MGWYGGLISSRKGGGKSSDIKSVQVKTEFLSLEDVSHGHAEGLKTTIYGAIEDLGMCET